MSRLTVPLSKTALQEASSNALIINGYLGSYYEEENIPKNVEIFDIEVEGFRLVRSAQQRASDILALLWQCSTFHLRESIMIRGNFQPTDMSSMTKQELIFCVLTRTDPSLVKKISQDVRIRVIETINKTQKS